METPNSSHGRLVDYLILVGPGRGVLFEKVTSADEGGRKSSLQLHDWQNISTPVSSILRRFPSTDHEDFKLAIDVSYFCQPEGCCVELLHPKSHVFMLTDKESNERTYCVCLTFPHLFDPMVHMDPSATGGASAQCADVTESICIQEWGALSVCILSHHPFFSFFEKCLRTLSHFMENFGSKDLSWNALIWAQYEAYASNVFQSTCRTGMYSPRTEVKNNGKMGEKKPVIISEVEEWIGNLLLLPAPGKEKGGEVGHCLEVELEVDPAFLVCYPPKNHLPLLDLPLHRMFQRVGVQLVLEIYKLLLSEQKVIFHSSDPGFSSECVLCMVELLYPLQYLYPVIPLLPTAMPSAEDLLMVPTPFLIGVCDSFMKKVKDYQMAEIWVISLDSRKIKQPSVLDQPLLQFPYNILQLQADIRKAIDKIPVLNKPGANEISGSGAAGPPTSHTAPLTSSSQPSTSPTGHTFKTNYPSSFLLDEVDVNLRIAFVQFLFEPEILGQVEHYSCIYRLFPRPVVALRASAFLSQYAIRNTNTDFIQEFMKTQCVEYFLQYSLNPTNLAFEDIKRGVRDSQRLSDKCHCFLHKSSLKIHQVTLYSPDSLLYQHMLTYKAYSTQCCSPDPDDSSEWEVLGEELYDRGSATSASSSYYSDEEGADGESGGDSGGCSPQTRQILSCDTRSVLKGNGALDGEAVEVSFHTPGKFSRSFEEVQICSEGSTSSKRKERRSGKKTEEPLSSSSSHSICPTVNIVERCGSFEGQSSSCQPGDVKLDVALGLQQHEDHSSNCSLSDAEVHARHHSNSCQEMSDRDVPGMFRTFNQISLDRTTSKDLEPLNYKRTNSLVVRGDRTGDVRGVISGRLLSSMKFSSPLVNQSPSGSHTLEVQIYDLALRIVEGQGLPWPKPAYLRRVANHEKTRILVLRQLEVKLGVREAGEMVMATGDQIIAVGVTKSVFKGVLELLKFLLVYVEDDLQKDSDGSIFSVFLIFRIAFSIYLRPNKAKHTISISLLNALNLSSFVTPTNKDPHLNEVRRSSIDSRDVECDAEELPMIYISDTDEEMEEMHILKKEKRASPLLIQKSSSGERSIKSDTDVLTAEADGDEEDKRMLSSNVQILSEEQGVSQVSASSLDLEPGQGGRETSSTEVLQPEVEMMTTAATATVIAVDHGSAGVSCESRPSPSLGGPSLLAGSSNCSPSREFEELLQNVDSDHSSSSLPQPSTPPASNPSSSSQLVFIPVKTIASITPISDSEGSSLRPPAHTRSLSPLEGSVTHSPQHMTRSTSDQSPRRSPSLSYQAILLSELINSPRFYHPHEGQELLGCHFVYKDLVKSLGQSREDLFHSGKFWNKLFISTVTMDRGSLGWNDKTASLYSRYDSLNVSQRHLFGFEEDSLISIILHNLLVYMLMMGLGSHKTMELVQRFSARTRLAIGEERLLQQTLKHIEQCIEEDSSKEVDINMLGLLALYSELHPTISYIVHYGIDMLAPVYKLQITDEVIILRRFPDGQICSRLWNDCISVVFYNKARATVSVRYRDLHGDYYHHFHTKQCMEVYKSMKVLVSPGVVEPLLSN